jgi:hypothetical protein
MEPCIVCGSLMLEMTNKGVGRQEGVEAGAVWTVYRQQLGTVETREDVSSVSRTSFLCWESSAHSVASARTGQCLRMWEIGGGYGKYWHCTLLLH